MPLALVATPEPRRAELDDLTLARAQRGDETAWRALVERARRPRYRAFSVTIDSTYPTLALANSTVSTVPAG